MITEQPLVEASSSKRERKGGKGPRSLPRYEQPSFKFMKRTADIGLSAAGLIIFAPVFLILGAIVVSADGGPIFFKQKRIGQYGEVFWMYKFRTMRKDAEKVLAEILEKDPEARKEYEQTFKLKNDPRLIRFGKFMRATSLDELPQFLNVLIGRMSIVGPRPMLLSEVEKMGDRIETYKKMKPGCAGLWQASGRNDVSYEARMALNEEYYRDASFRRDFVVLWNTLKAMLLTRGAY